MKRNLLSLTLMALMPMMSMGQTAVGQDDVITVDSRSRAFRQGEVLVKFKQESNARVREGARATGVNSVDAVLSKIGVTEVEALMPMTGAAPMQSKSRSLHGDEMNVAELSQLYRVKFDAAKSQNVHEVVDAFKELGDVEYAEPNYLVYALQAEESEVTYTDPLLSEQWGLGAINLPQLWSKPTITDKRPVIAILDTGVDIEHPDLKDNIWTNPLESTGSEGQDDDGNGFADDIHGWDFVNQTGHMDDFNGHGTHCAGIAGATGGNGIGIVGANPDALIMPIAVLQSDGVGDVATIIKGIDYAAANGADVISMSFGGYAYSIAEEQALGRAYATAVLVAAAGNDGCCVYPGGHCILDAPSYPAAFTFVFGVQSSLNGSLALWSNFDPDGPIFFDVTIMSEEQMYNYELLAPGSGIYSTYPGGKYKSMSGTSMACPLVAGAISRLLQIKEYPKKEVLFGDIIHTRKNNMEGDIDMLAAYNLTDEDRKPELNIVTYELNDTEGGDGDLRADAGETINFYPTLRNFWGEAKNIKVWLTVGENEDETIVEFLDAEQVDFGLNLSSYAKSKGTNPIRFKVRDNCVDGRNIKLVLHATCDNIAEELAQDFTITVENGVEIGGMIDKDMTLRAGVHYIVTKTLAIPEGVTLTLQPGVVLKLKDNVGIVNNGTLIAKGTPEQRVIITKTDLGFGYCDRLLFGNNPLEYVTIDGLILPDMKHECIGGSFYKCVMKNCTFPPFASFDYMMTTFDNGLFQHNRWGQVWGGGGPAAYVPQFSNTNYVANQTTVTPTDMGIAFYETMFAYPLKGNNIVGNIDLPTGKIFTLSVGTYSTTAKIIPIHSYLGSGQENIVRESVWDIEHGYGYNKFDLSNMLTRPNPEATGIVWKVVVNGYDAQDEFEMLPPLGVGKHKFEVYYSKPVSKGFTPTIGMGVRPPYNSTSIAEDGSWNEAGDIYTAYVTITGKMANDGLNRIYVEGGEDLEHFEIPIENTRFNVMIQAAGSMSSGFMGEAGLGKVDLTWEEQTEEDVDDILGYNMYRYQVNDGGTSTDTVRLNTRMIDSDVTTYTDYDVVPGETYYYYYKIMRTSLTENSPSKTVAVTPLTASKGDANGSMAVEISDVITEINYMTGQNPQPFIFDAADVNSDLAINILDVIGTINIILAPESVGTSSINGESVVYSVENDTLYIDTPVELAGLQFAFEAEAGTKFTPLAALDGFEHAGQWTAENKYMFLVYSLSGKTLKPGRHAIMAIDGAKVAEVMLSDTRGRNIVAVEGFTTGISEVEKIQMQVAYPNPFREQVTIPYVVGKDGNHDVRIAFSNLAGITLHNYNTTATYGEYSYTWTPARSLPQGMYFATLYVDGRKIQTVKLVHVK